MKDLINKLKKETASLREAYIAKTINWAEDEFVRLKKFVADYRSNYDVKKEKFYWSLPTCIINQSGTVDQFVDIQVKRAEKHYENSITKLAERIEKKGLNVDNLTLSTSYLDPNISTKITDGEKTINAYTVIASGMIQKPHYRYLIK